MRFRDWEEIQLKDIIDVQVDNRGKNPDKYLDYSNYPVIDNYLIKNQKYPDMSKVNRYIDRDDFDNFLRGYVMKNDVLITLVGNGIGNVTMVPSPNSVIIQNTLGLRTNEKASNLFLYYSLLNNQEKIKNFDRGTSQPSIKKTDLFKFVLQLPPLNEQKAIAHILSTLDEKIETNNQINKTLEKMAQSIFKHWFVDFEFLNENGEPYKSSGGEMIESELGMIPKGWEVKSLDEIATMKNGVNYSREQEGNEIKVINVRDFDGSLVANKSKLDSILLPERQINDYLLEQYDTVVVRSAKPGETLLIFDNNEVVYSGFTIRVRSNEKLLKLFIFYSIRNAMRMLSNSSNGTVFKNLNQQILGSLKVIVPKSNIVEIYNSLIIYLLELINEKIKEVDILSNLRDTLLPKLMSGEIRVPLDN